MNNNNADIHKQLNYLNSNYAKLWLILCLSNSCWYRSIYWFTVSHQEMWQHLIGRKWILDTPIYQCTSDQQINNWWHSVWWHIYNQWQFDYPLHLVTITFKAH